MHTCVLKLDGNSLTFSNVFVQIFLSIAMKCVVLQVVAVISVLDMFLQTSFRYIALSLLAIMFSVALEETFHIITAIVINKESALRGVAIRSLYLKKVPLLCYNAAVRFQKSMLTDTEHAEIAFGGAFCSFVISLALAIILILLGYMLGVVVAISLLVTPIISLIPSCYGAFRSDGYIVLCMIHNDGYDYKLFSLPMRILKEALRPCLVRNTHV